MVLWVPETLAGQDGWHTTIKHGVWDKKLVFCCLCTRGGGAGNGTRNPKISKILSKNAKIPKFESFFFYHRGVYALLLQRTSNFFISSQENSMSCKIHHKTPWMVRLNTHAYFSPKRSTRKQCCAQLFKKFTRKAKKNQGKSDKPKKMRCQLVSLCVLVYQKLSMHRNVVFWLIGLGGGGRWWYPGLTLPPNSAGVHTFWNKVRPHLEIAVLHRAEWCRSEAVRSELSALSHACPPPHSPAHTHGIGVCSISLPRGWATFTRAGQGVMDRRGICGRTLCALWLS